MSLHDLIQALAATDMPDRAIDEIPYAAFLGLRAHIDEDALIIGLPFQADLVGQPYPARLHGGVIGGLLETTATLTVARALHRRAENNMPPVMPKPISVTLDYIREGAPAETFARAHIIRLGRRIANVRAEAWQADRARLISTAHINLLVG